jgi:hypothetical protein
MSKRVEEAFDCGQVILVPVDTENPDFEIQDYEVKLVVLDKKLLVKGKNMIWSWDQPDQKTKKYFWDDVDGKPLDFREAKGRPAKRFLYFNYLHTIIRYAAQRPKEWEYGLKQLNQLGTSWATPGSYLARGMLKRFKRQAKKDLADTYIDEIAPTANSEEDLSTNGPFQLVQALLESSYDSGDEDDQTSSFLIELSS